MFLLECACCRFSCNTYGSNWFPNLLHLEVTSGHNGKDISHVSPFVTSNSLFQVLRCSLVDMLCLDWRSGECAVAPPLFVKNVFHQGTFVLHLIASQLSSANSLFLFVMYFVLPIQFRWHVVVCFGASIVPYMPREVIWWGYLFSCLYCYCKLE